jgi:RES domain-containing protein
MTQWVIAYRHAAYDTPWWAYPSSRSGRFHRATIDTVQYLSLHPLGPAAEMLRHNVGPTGDPDDVVLNIWAVVADLDRVTQITFDDCPTHGITPDDLVGDDYRPTQALADELRASGVAGLIVPSAALPGANNLVLFGVRVIHPYLAVPFNTVECPTGHLSDGARTPAEVASLVRWFGAPHPALESWRTTGAYDLLDGPLALRW